MAGSFGYEKEHYRRSLEIGEMVLFPAVRRALGIQPPSAAASATHIVASSASSVAPAASPGTHSVASSAAFSGAHIAASSASSAAFPAVHTDTSSDGPAPTATPAVVVAPGTSCRQQIFDGTGARAVHPVELLYRWLK
jgi:hypothetical protein